MNLNKYIVKNKLLTKNIIKKCSVVLSAATLLMVFAANAQPDKITQQMINDNKIQETETVSIIPAVASNNTSRTRTLNLSDSKSITFNTITYDESTITVDESLTEEAFFEAVLKEETVVDAKHDLTLEESSIIANTQQPVYYEKDKPKPQIKSVTSKTIQVPVFSEEEIAANALTPYLAPVDNDERSYNYGNMIEAPATPDITDMLTDLDLEYMARIIHCESNFGYDSRRAVGTVVVNRLYSSLYPNTIYGVISQPYQFSPYASGKFASCTPNEEDYAAAYDVLYNNYRSFPYYVDSFQSIRDGYFRGQKTYVTYKIGNYRQYFSYNPKHIKN